MRDKYSDSRVEASGQENVTRIIVPYFSTLRFHLRLRTLTLLFARSLKTPLLQNLLIPFIRKPKPCTGYQSC
jgi:hypothetical protein